MKNIEKFKSCKIFNLLSKGYLAQMLDSLVKQKIEFTVSVDRGGVKFNPEVPIFRGYSSQDFIFSLCNYTFESIELDFDNLILKFHAAFGNDCEYESFVSVRFDFIRYLIVDDTVVFVNETINNTDNAKLEKSRKLFEKQV